MTLTELKAKLDQLSPAKIRFVENVVDSLSNPPRASICERETWITDVPDWIEYFGLAVSVHHGTTTEPLGLTAFEAVFRNACESVNWTLDPPGSSTQRFVDLVVRGGHGPKRRLSLKSTAAMNLSKTRVHISKLTEAAWIQDERTSKNRRRRTLKLFQEYQQTRRCNHYAARVPREGGPSKPLSASRNSNHAIRFDPAGSGGGFPKRCADHRMPQRWSDRRAGRY